MNSSNVKMFTDSLYELVVEQKVSLGRSLEIMSFERNTFIGSVCTEIKNELLKGSSFSGALKKNSCIEFDDIYISFIRLAEVSGNLNDTLKFLKKRCERQELNRQKLVDATIYPFFVIILSFAVCVFFSKFSSQMNLSIQTYSPVSAVIVLFSVCFFMFYLIISGLKENKLYEAFLAVGFLVKSGINVSSAISAGVIIAGPGTKYGNYFQKAKKRIEYGMDIFGAFYEFQFDTKLKNIFYFAKIGSSQTDMFERIALKIGYEDEKRKKRILGLIEPLFIGIIGLFLLILMVTYFLPMMTDMSWVEL